MRGGYVVAGAKYRQGKGFLGCVGCETSTLPFCSCIYRDKTDLLSVYPAPNHRGRSLRFTRNWKIDPHHPNKGEGATRQDVQLALDLAQKDLDLHRILCSLLGKRDPILTTRTFAINSQSSAFLRSLQETPLFPGSTDHAIGPLRLIDVCEGVYGDIFELWSWVRCLIAPFAIALLHIYRSLTLHRRSFCAISKNDRLTSIITRAPMHP